VVCSGLPGGPQQFQGKIKALQKLYQILNEWKICPYMSVLKLTLLVDLQQKVGELVLSITSCPSIIILENTYFKLVYIKNEVTVTLTTGILFLLFTCMHSCVWEISWRWFSFALTAYAVVRDCWKFRKHCCK
jgi:hypothetical protein